MALARGAGGVRFALPRNSIPWLVAVFGALAVGDALWWLSAFGDSSLAGRLTGAASLPAGILVLVGALELRGGSEADPRVRRAWLLIALGLASYGTGSMLRFGISALPWLGVLAPAVAVLEIGTYPIIWIALATLPTSARSRAEVVLFSLDVAVVAWSTAMLLWHFVLFPIGHANGVDPATVLTVAVFPVGDISLVFSIGAMVMFGLIPSARPALVIGAVALVLIFAADLLAGLQELQGGYTQGGLSGVIYSVAWLGLAAAVYLHGHVVAGPQHVRGLAGYARSFPWLVYLVAGVAFLAPAARDWTDLGMLQQHMPASALLMALVLARLMVTARQNAILAAAERERLATAVEQSSEAILTTDGSGAVTYVNGAFTRLTGYPRAAVVGLRPAFLREDADPARLADMDAAMARGEAWQGRIREKKRDGSGLEVDLTVTPLRDPSGSPAGSVEVFRDVSREQDLEAQLTEAQRMEAVGRLAGGVAHDFNNILTAISGFAELAMEEVGGERPAADDLAQILRASDRAAALTRALLAFGRRGVMARQNVDLNEVLAGLTPMLGVLTAEDIRLSIETEPELWPALTDRAQFEQVVLNLAMNARDAMPNGGRLTIATANVSLDEDYARTHIGAASGPHVRLVVADTGVGMEREVLSHAFEPFFTTKARGKGTGLGLSTVIGVVQQSGGFVDVRSAPGEGTVFTIYLPRGEGPVEDEQSAWAGGTRRGGGETILVAEDEGPVRAYVERVLSRAGYRVAAAANGPEALSMAAGLGDIDMLFTDMVMPGMGGRELAAQLAATHPGLRTLYASGYSEEAARQGLGHDAATYLPKPFTAESLLERIREILDGDV
jgi:PAS domain S-box-containing protein